MYSQFVLPKVIPGLCSKSNQFSNGYNFICFGSVQQQRKKYGDFKQTIRPLNNPPAYYDIRI